MMMLHQLVICKSDLELQLFVTQSDSEKVFGL